MFKTWEFYTDCLDAVGVCIQFAFIVQVKVPDPEVVERLQQAEEKNDKLQKDYSNLQKKLDILQGEMAKLKGEMAVLEGKVRITGITGLSCRRDSL